MRCVVVLLAILGPGAGCLLSEDNRVCTLIGAPEGLNLDATLTNGTFDDGIYDVIVRADGAELSARWDLNVQPPCTPEPRSPTISGECLAEVDLGDRLLTLRTYLERGVEGYIQVVYTPAELGGPEIVEVEVKRNDVSLVTRTFTPTYRNFAPNGPGCGTFRYYEDVLPITLR